MKRDIPRPEGSGTLFLVPTPIGHLGDVTLRALEVLAAADVLAAEDTRHTRRLLDRHGIRARSVSLHRFNEEESAGRLVDALLEGRDVACVTDAGTPGVADPGARLVTRARAAGIRVVPLPGPSAPVAAVSASGWEGGFVFEGWVERRKEARERQIRAAAGREMATVLFEAPARLKATLEEAERIAPQMEILVAREMTKVHEEYEIRTAGEHLRAMTGRVRGEVTLVLLPPPVDRDRGEAPEKAVEAVLAMVELGVRLADAARIVGRLTGTPSRQIYRKAVDRR